MQNTFHVGQLVRLKEQCTGQGSGRPYCVIDILILEDEGTPAYRIKNMVGIEQVVKPQDIKAAPAQSLP